MHQSTAADCAILQIEIVVIFEQTTTEQFEMSLQDHERPAVNPLPAICNFYLAHKKRFCKTAKRPGFEYCHTHQAELHPDMDPNMKRIPCPINGNHSIYEKDLKRHLPICPDRRHDTTVLPYFSENCHALRGRRYTPGDDLAPVVECASLKESDDEDDDDKAERVAGCSTRFTHREMTADAVEKLCEKVMRVFEQRIAPHIVKSHNDGVIESDAVKRVTMKHTSQHIGLIGLIEEALSHRILAKGSRLPPTGFIELGAGKGGLAHAIYEHMSKDLYDGARMLVVDIGGFRRKRDGCHSSDSKAFIRLRINIKDLALSQVPELCSLLPTDDANDVGKPPPLRSSFVTMGKHLCGACTDFALSCVTTETPSQFHNDVVVIATCCHQLCEARHMNPLDDSNELEICGVKFTAQEFAAMASMSSWAICGVQRVGETKQAIGYACKRIIDSARVAYLKRCGYSYAALHEYVSRSCTGENVCIVAWK